VRGKTPESPKKSEKESLTVFRLSLKMPRKSDYRMFRENLPPAARIG
jgi:hypothetical protein